MSSIPASLRRVGITTFERFDPASLQPLDQLAAEVWVADLWPNSDPHA
jgi:hypothetical protein